MDAFRYKAIDERGRLRRGRTEAVNAADLETRLSRLGLDLIDYRELKASRHDAGRGGIRRVDLITFCFHLEQLIRAGVPILEGLADLRDSVGNRRLREVTAALIESIEGGRNLSGAMADFPAVFDPVLVSLIRAGEQSGRLTAVLAKVIENLKWQDEQAALTRRLLMYPAVVGVVLTATLVFMMIYVVPQLLSFLSNMGQALPLQTRALIAFSRFFSQYWYLVFGLPLAAAGSAWIAVRASPEFAQRFDAWKLRLPVLGPIARKIIVTRVCTVFSIMYTSGITVLECIRASEEVAGNRAVGRALRDAGRMIQDGGGISASFAASGLFPPLVVRMLRVGENAGALDEALDNVSYFFTRDVQESVDRLQAMLLPTMVIVLGAFMLWIVVSVFGPLYDLFTHVKI
ncbi:MAG: type II secretion system F family protein [Gammaproteobacteria bacterium]|nr:type II secretion system F family protein [Gammaproteobacteria bacterium]